MIISRIPEWVKKIIIDKAESEHCGDYGACISQLVRDALEYNQLKHKFLDDELNVSLLIKDKHNEVEDEKEKIKFGNGKELERGKN